MKKIFSMLLLVGALFATSCDKDDDNEPIKFTSYKGDKYIGVMTISIGDMPTSANQENVSFYFDEKNDFATVTLAKISFTKGLSDIIPSLDKDPFMPALDIMLPNIPEANQVVSSAGDRTAPISDASTYGMPSIIGDSYYAESVKPCKLDGETYDNNIIKSIENITVIERDEIDTLYVTFDCTVAISALGDEPATFTVSYTGVK